MASRHVERPDGGGPVIVALRDVDRTQVAGAGGKGALLGELSQLDGVRVPPGFCVTTHAFRRFIDGAPTIEEQLAELGALRSDDSEAIRATSAEIRSALERLTIPDDVAGPIDEAIAALDQQLVEPLLSRAHSILACPDEGQCAPDCHR